MIEFLCPNGHKVHCSESRAGQAAKCPRCGVPFRIPTVEEVRGADLAGSGSGSSVPVGSGSGVESPASGVGLGAATSPDQVEFLCPNDHLLHGPASLQGRPGRCPVCGSRFRIPDYDEPSASEPPQLPIEADGAEPADPSSEFAGLERALADADPYAGVDAQPAVESDGPTRGNSTMNPTARLVARLWRFKSQGATIELRYGEGHRLTPDQCIASLASASHGVFAVREPNGTLTLTAIPWDAIHVVIAKGVRPSDVNEG